MSDEIVEQVRDGPKSGGRWWQPMLWAVICAGAGVFLFHIFDDLGRNGGSVRMNLIVVEIYKLLGKWGVLGILLAGAVAFAVIGIRQRTAGKSVD